MKISSMFSLSLFRFYRRGWSRKEIFYRSLTDGRTGDGSKLFSDPNCTKKGGKRLWPGWAGLRLFAVALIEFPYCCWRKKILLLAAPRSGKGHNERRRTDIGIGFLFFGFTSPCSLSNMLGEWTTSLALGWVPQQFAIQDLFTLFKKKQAALLISHFLHREKKSRRCLLRCRR